MNLHDLRKSWPFWLNRIRIAAVAVGWAGYFLTGIFGVAGVAAIWGTVQGHLDIALAAAALIAYYGFRLFVQVQKWARDENVTDAMAFQANQCLLLPTADGKFNVILRFQLANASNHKIYFRVVDEIFRIGNLIAEPQLNETFQVINPKWFAGQQSAPIEGVTGKHDFLRCRLTVEYGKATTSSECRWEFEADVFLPPPMSDNTVGPLGGYNIIRTLVTPIRH